MSQSHLCPLLVLGVVFGCTAQYRQLSAYHHTHFWHLPPIFDLFKYFQLSSSIWTCCHILSTTLEWLNIFLTTHTHAQAPPTNFKPNHSFSTNFTLFWLFSSIFDQGMTRRVLMGLFLYYINSKIVGWVVLCQVAFSISALLCRPMLSILLHLPFLYIMWHCRILKCAISRWMKFFLYDLLSLLCFICNHFIWGKIKR